MVRMAVDGKNKTRKDKVFFMIKYQILSVLFWPDIKFKKTIKYNWVLYDIKLLGKGVILKFKRKTERINLLLKKSVKKERGQISRNFKLSVLAKNEEEHKIIIDKNKEFIKYVVAVLKKNDTADFLFLEDKKFYRENPFGIVFTITHKCNMMCKFCFNSYDYSLKTRNQQNDLSIKNIKLILDKFYNDGIRYLILSGGEPTMRKDFFEILEYACKKNFYVVLNTNGVLLDRQLIKKICQFPVHIMLSIHEFDDDESYLKTGLKNVFSKRLNAIKLLKKYNVLCLEYITALNRKNIDNLETIYNMNLGQYAPDNWQFFRVFDSNGEPGSSKKEMCLAIDKLHNLNAKYNLNYKIVDSVPFCVHNDPYKASQVISGELNEEHLVKMVTDPKGGIRMMCSFEKNLGDALQDNVKKCFKSNFAKKMVNLDFVPGECHNCVFLKECCGGSRFVAHAKNGSYFAKDPLVNYNNKKVKK